jgi:hypothetical protein
MFWRLAHGWLKTWANLPSFIISSVVGSPPPTKVARTQAEEAVEAVEVAPIAKVFGTQADS